MCLEDSGFHPHTAEAGEFDERFVQSARLSGGSGIIETGAAPFAAVTVKRELGNHQHAALRIQQTAIHLAGFVGKDAQMHKFIHQKLSVRHRVRLGYAQQHQHPRADFARDQAVYFHARFRYPLDDNSHSSRVDAGGALDHLPYRRPCAAGRIIEMSMTSKNRKHSTLPGGFFHLEEEKTRTRVAGYGYGDNIKLKDDYGNIWQGRAERMENATVIYRFRDGKGRTLTGVSDSTAVTLLDEKGCTWKGFID